MDAPNGHKRKLRIVLVEDDPNDIELTQIHLRTYRITCEIVAVDTKPAFESELKRRPDLILSNLNLVLLDGLSALDIAAKKCPTTPFVFLSGTIREETRAVASIRGATDLVLKHDTEHLVAVIRRVCQVQTDED